MVIFQKYLKACIVVNWLKVSSESIKSEIKITQKTPLDGNTKYVEIVVPLKYLSNFWRTLEMPLINGEINLVLTWLEDYVISSATVKAKFAIEVAKLYVLAVGSSTFCFII